MKRIKLKIAALRSLERAEQFNNPQLKKKALQVLKNIRTKNAERMGL